MSKRRDWTNKSYGRYGTVDGRKANALERASEESVDQFCSRLGKESIEKWKNLVSQFTVGQLHEAMYGFSEGGDMFFSVGEMPGCVRITDSSQTPKLGDRFQVRVLEIDEKKPLLIVELIRPISCSPPT